MIQNKVIIRTAVMKIHVSVKHPQRAVTITEGKWHCVKHLYTTDQVLTAIL